MKVNRQIILLVLVSFILVFSWYKPGLAIGGGEEGLAFVNPKQTAQLYKYTWDSTQTGASLSTSVSRYPAFLILGELQKLGIHPGLSQITLFFLLTLLAGIFTYLLTKQLFPVKPRAWLFAALFYILNTFTFSVVWHRFISPMFFFFPLLPASIYFYLKYTRENKIIHLLLFAGVNILFSYAFSSPALVITLWASIAVFAFYDSISIKKIWLLIISLSLWILTNWWWVQHLLATAGGYSSIFGADYNLTVLRSISTQYPFSVYSLLRYPSAISGIANTSTLLFIAVIIYGFLKIIIKKTKRLFIFLIAVSFFVLNGSNFPTGFLFEFFFTKFSPLQLLRNPYEKFGILLSLSYSILFGFGLYKIFNKSKIKGYILIFVLTFTIVVPTWNGIVFGSEEYNAYVQIPEDYNTVNNILNQDKSGSRSLSVPIIPGDSVHFGWETPYYGIQPNRYLFSSSVMGRITRVHEIDGYWEALRRGYYQGTLSNLARYGNLKYLIVHKDLDTVFSGLDEKQKELIALTNYTKPSNSNKTVICDGYIMDTQCDVSELNWKEVGFIVLELEESAKGFIRLELQDSNQQYLVYNGELDIYYQIEPDTKKLIIDTRIPTGRHERFSEDIVQYLSVRFVPDVENENIKLSEISITEGESYDVKYLDNIFDGKYLSLYEIISETESSKIYSPKLIESANTWATLIQNQYFPDAFVLNKHKTADIDFNFEAQFLPEISYTKINPEEYEVSIKNAKNPYWLVFSESYNTNWRITDVQNYKHFTANGFTNGYYIEKVGDYEFKLKYN